MTKANENARAKVKDAERRARSKIKRLQKKGIRTGSISPFKNVDQSNTRELNRYYNSLEKFISRSTRFVAGVDGTPIPYNAYRDYRRVEKEWNKVHNKYWRKFADQPFLTAYGETDTTMGMRSRMGHVKGLPYGDIDYERMTPADKIRSLKDLQRRKKALETEISPSYQRKRTKELRKNMLEFAQYLNNPKIVNAIKKLTNEQLFVLQNFTDFVPLFYHRYNGSVDGQNDTVTDAMEDEAMNDHLLMTIEQVKAAAPKAKRSDIKIKGQNKKDKTKGVKNKTAKTLSREYNERNFVENSSKYSADLRGVV